MGGKSYFCDYCRCYMKNDINVRKTHNEGTAHKIIKANIMKKYEDPRKIYEEEIDKQPCVRYFRSYCKYDFYCQYSHFDENNLKQLKTLIDNLNTKSQQSKSFKNTKKFKKSKCSTKLPLQNSITKSKQKLLPTKLTPSLRPINLKKLAKLDVSKSNWGE